MPRPALPRPIALVAATLTRAQWHRADNRTNCAPLALAGDRAGGSPRAASFAGGWGIAFDQPDRRSAYGIAGVGALPDDQLDFAQQVDRLARQWPYVRRWDAGQNLPAGSIAGYGLEGAIAYRDDNPSGVGENSVAYVRLPGQSCLYNVWSRLGRDHLMQMLSDLRLVEAR
ncbi:hypothetical protein SH584_07235 [Sphingomonas sp. LY29]|uniref:hypothetical protein n=1 Tax=Sphingomonas sp. LY29 TaxID=3095341 RepID=UPI002D7712B4|nr:hypothetical protein [Sphingomonas sp. LY29]WRP24855.1 hypothetical protein SH584_07235 [Sphingomonas sp. LY29]